MNFTKSAFEVAQTNSDFFIESHIDENFDIENFKEELSIFNAYTEIKGDNHWENVRDLEKFELKLTEYSFGTRLVYFPTTEQNYTDIQISRGGVEILDEGLEASIKKFIEASGKIYESDRLRISEINAIKEKVAAEFDLLMDQAPTVEDQHALKKAFAQPDLKFVHLGCRSLNLLNYYSKNGFAKTVGCDINELTVGVCRKLGANAALFNMMKDVPLVIKDADVIVAYHVLECSPDPLNFLKRLKNKLSIGAQLHVEVTIEPGTPRIRYAHLFPFEKGDLQAMLIEAGFMPISLSNIPHPGGPEIERIFAVVK